MIFLRLALILCGLTLWYGGWIIMEKPATSWELPTLGHAMVLAGAFAVGLAIVVGQKRRV